MLDLRTELALLLDDHATLKAVVRGGDPDHIAPDLIAAIKARTQKLERVLWGRNYFYTLPLATLEERADRIVDGIDRHEAPHAAA